MLFTAVATGVSSQCICPGNRDPINRLHITTHETQTKSIKNLYLYPLLSVFHAL